MTSSTIKKISAAAVTAVMAVASFGVANAGTLPYKQSFEPVAPASDNPQFNYLPAVSIVGQGSFTTQGDVGTGGTVQLANTVPNTTAANGLQVVKIQNVPGSSQVYSDITNTSYNGSGILNVRFDASHGASTGSNASRFGVQILNSSQTAVLGGFYLGEAPVASNPTGPFVPTLFADTTGNGGTAIPFGVNDTGSGGGGVARADGAWGTYSIKIDPTNDTFTVFVGGNNADGGTYHFGTASGGSIGGIALASIGDTGGTAANEVAYFDNLTVVPEPTGIAMVGIGSLLLLAKRPKRLA